MMGHPMIGEWTNHLWQSTLFAMAAALMTLAFRQNRAHVRYCLWLSASVKFLVPFALLMNLGNSLWSALAARQMATELASPAVSHTVQQIAQPFTENLSFAPSTSLTHTADWILIAVVSVWICGFLGVLLVRFRGWLRVRAAMRASMPINVQAEAAVRSSPGLLEPGVVGVVRPTLLLPEDILKHLPQSQLKAVIAHELSHVRRRDNLTAAIHMVVEAVFWFHPFVWWIGARLVEERERACDEAVLSLGCEPRDYADAIVSVCKLYVESPLACVAGISGADLKKRIVRIMARHVGLSMGQGRKLFLGAAGLLAVAVPVAFGVMRMVPGYAQILHATGPLPSYEVATIKQINGPPNIARGGRDMQYFVGTIKMFIQGAYGVPFEAEGRVLGGPSWIDSDRYVIGGKLPADLFAKLQTMTIEERIEQGDLLHQSLLADRFKLKVHFETREMPIYELVVAKGGSKLTPAKVPAPGAANPTNMRQGVTTQPNPNGPGSEMITTGEPLDMFLRVLPVHDRPIVDKTGLTGRYDFTMNWVPDPPAGAESTQASDGPSIFTALQEQLGLKLQPAKGMVEVVVIDSIERPTEN